MPKSQQASPLSSRTPRIYRNSRGVHFDFQNLQLNDQGLLELLRSSRQEALSKRQLDHFEAVYFADVELQHNSITGTGVRHLLRFLEALVLRPRSVRLDHNSICNDGLLLIVEFMQNSALPFEQLHMSHNYLTEQSIRPLLKALATHGAYPRAGPEGTFVPLWLRLEHNCIGDVGAVLTAARQSGCSFCNISAQTASRCSASRCANCSFQDESTPKVHLVHADAQDSAKRPPCAIKRDYPRPSPLNAAPNPFQLGNSEDPELEVQNLRQSRTYADCLVFKQPHTVKNKKHVQARKDSADDDDLAFALALSLSMAEEGKREVQEEFPPLGKERKKKT